MKKKAAALIIALLIIASLGTIVLTLAFSVVAGMAATTSLADGMVAEQASLAGIEYGSLQLKSGAADGGTNLPLGSGITADVVISGGGTVITSTGHFGRVLKKHTLRQVGGGYLFTPTVRTDAADDIHETSATLRGAILDTGGENASERGFQYVISSGGFGGWCDFRSSTTFPESGSFGTVVPEYFSHELTGLDAGKLYCFKAFATNSQGPSYGGIQRFITKSLQVQKLYPNQDVSTQWDCTRGGAMFISSCSAGGHYQVINEDPAKDTDYISDQPINNTDVYGFTDADINNIAQIRVHVRGKFQGLFMNNTDNLLVNINMNEWQTSQPITIASNFGGANYQDYVVDFFRPEGATWGETELKDLQVQITKNSASGELRISQMYVDVFYSNP